MYIILFLFLILILFCYIYKINIKTLKKIKDFGRENKDLDEIVKKYPSNIEICKFMLKKLKNDNVKIEENKEYQSSFYIAISNKIIIANIEKSYTRIQTIAHECLHSIQDRRKLLFNYIYSNIYILTFIIILILGIAKLIPEHLKTTIICIYAIMGYIYYSVRSFLENDAMIKAKFLSKEYIDNVNISTEEEKKLIIKKYEELYEIGVPFTNFNLFFGTILKTLIIQIVFLIR